MGYADSMNLYQALNMNSVNFMDPFGEKLYIRGDNQFQFESIKDWLDMIFGQNNIFFYTPYAGNNQALSGSYEVSIFGQDLSFSSMNNIYSNDTYAPIPLGYEHLMDKRNNIGGWLINQLILSQKIYFLGIGNTYPTLRNLSTQSVCSLLNGRVGVEVNLDPNPDWRFQYGNPNAQKPQSVLPPIGIDSIVWFHPDFLNSSRPIEYYSETNLSSLGNLEALYFVVFHELLEAYYKIEEGRTYRLQNNPQSGAHPFAIRDENTWRTQLNRMGRNVQTNVTGGVVRRK
jgi:hypothetical protein